MLAEGGAEALLCERGHLLSSPARHIHFYDAGDGAFTTGHATGTKQNQTKIYLFNDPMKKEGCFFYLLILF